MYVWGAMAHVPMRRWDVYICVSDLHVCEWTETQSLFKALVEPMAANMRRGCAKGMNGEKWEEGSWEEGGKQTAQRGKWGKIEKWGGSTDL